MHEKSLIKNCDHEHRTSQPDRPAAREAPAPNSPRKAVPDDSSPADEKMVSIFCAVLYHRFHLLHHIQFLRGISSPTIISCMHSTIWLPLYSPLSMGYELRQLPCNTPAATMPGRHVCATCSLFMESSTSWQLSRSW